MNKPASKFENFLGASVLTWLGSTLLFDHIRDYVKQYPHMRQQVIDALKALLQELENQK